MENTITDIVIVRRTFEGKIDPSKNDDPVTSKYMPSHKVAVVYMKNGKRAVETFATKSEARQWLVLNACHKCP